MKRCAILKNNIIIAVIEYDEKQYFNNAIEELPLQYQFKKYVDIKIGDKAILLSPIFSYIKRNFHYYKSEFSGRSNFFFEKCDSLSDDGDYYERYYGICYDVNLNFVDIKDDYKYLRR